MTPTYRPLPTLAAKAGETPEAFAYRALQWLCWDGGTTATLTENELLRIDHVAIVAVQRRETLPQVVERVSEVRHAIIRALQVIKAGEPLPLVSVPPKALDNGGSKVPVSPVPKPRPSPSIADPF